MADLSVTPASVLYVSGPFDGTRLAGEALVAGQSVYVKADNKYYKADSDSAGKQTVAGVALVSAGIGTPVEVGKAGCVYVSGATMTKGLPYFQSATAGGICPVGDLAAGMSTSLVIVATSATQAIIAAYNSGAVT